MIIYGIYSTSLQPKEKCAHLRNSLKDCAPYFIKVLFQFLCAKKYISKVRLDNLITIREYYDIQFLIFVIRIIDIFIMLNMRIMKYYRSVCIWPLIQCLLSNIFRERNSTITFTCTEIEISFQSLKSNTKDTLMSREKPFVLTSKNLSSQ